MKLLIYLSPYIKIILCMVMVLIYNCFSRILSVSPSACRMFGFKGTKGKYDVNKDDDTLDAKMDEKK